MRSARLQGGSTLPSLPRPLRRETVRPETQNHLARSGPPGGDGLRFGFQGDGSDAGRLGQLCTEALSKIYLIFQVLITTPMRQENLLSVQMR